MKKGTVNLVVFVTSAAVLGGLALAEVEALHLYAPLLAAIAWALKTPGDLIGRKEAN